MGMKTPFIITMANLSQNTSAVQFYEEKILDLLKYKNQWIFASEECFGVELEATVEKSKAGWMHFTRWILNLFRCESEMQPRIFHPVLNIFREIRHYFVNFGFLYLYRNLMYSQSLKFCDITRKSQACESDALDTQCTSGHRRWTLMEVVLRTECWGKGGKA